MEVVKYLVMISGDGRIEEEIWSTIGQVARFLGVLNDPVWKWEELSKRTKLYNRVYNAIVVPTLLYENKGGGVGKKMAALPKDGSPEFSSAVSEPRGKCSRVPAVAATCRLQRHCGRGRP